MTSSKQTVKHNDLRTLLDTKPNVIEGKIIKHIEYLRDVRKLNASQMEIQQILDKSDVRSRVVILLIVSTGMRIGAIPELRISDMKKIDEFNLYLIWVYNSSKKDRYYSFTTPECAQAIDAYLEYRKKCGENIREHAPLIINKISIDNPFTAATPRFVSERAIELMVENLLKAGLRDKQSRPQVMRSQGLRKFFINQIDRAGIHYTIREYLAGHKLPGTNESFVRATEEDRLVEYVKAIDLLTISDESRLKQDLINYEESKSLHEVVELRKRFDELKESIITGEFFKFNPAKI